MAPKVKICGVRTVEAALEATKNGADMIGLIFAKSKRQISFQQAKEIVDAIDHWFSSPQDASAIVEPIQRNSDPKIFQPERDLEPWFQSWREEFARIVAIDPQRGKKRPLVVGVFSNQPVDHINDAVKQTGIDLVQLHGDEEDEMIKKILVPVIRAVHVSPQDSPKTVRDRIRPGYYGFILLDTKVNEAGQQGGLGIPFDWTVALALSKDFPIIVAGGLTSKNVKNLRNVLNPWAVDVSSGVETDGVKDLTKIAAFIQAASFVE
jgi:anthranilate synthase/indole-3-glycerol phosphate synthase/phosphoribosylanthranilate isomerase